jgi:hypothetical protein
VSRSIFPLYHGEPASLEPQWFVFSQLREISGVAEDTLKRWIKTGVIRPTLGTQGIGTGGIRLFRAEEVIVAAALTPFAGTVMPLERLGLLARVFRNALNDRLIGEPPSGIEQLHRGVRRALLQAARGYGGDNLVAVAFAESVHIMAFTDTQFDLAKFRVVTGAPATATILLADMTACLTGIMAASPA